MLDMNRGSDLGMQSQKLILGVITFGMLIVISFLTAMVVENEAGSISAAVRTIGFFLAVCAAIKPKVGLYIVTIEAFSLDFIKKIAVYYGTSSQDTIIQVLIVGMLAVVGTVLGVIVQGVVLRAYKFRAPHWFILIGAGLVALVIFASGFTTYGAIKSGENAFNGGAYIALALPIMVLITSWDEVHKLLTLQFWLAVVWAIWGIKQYHFGFTALEWYYADTGLSETASAHFFFSADPRPFGFGSGVSNYAILSAYLCYGIWRCWRNSADRFKFGVGSLILLWGVVTSMQRTMLLLPILTLVFYYCFRTKGRTLFIYGATITTFVTAVLTSELLFDFFNDINDAIGLSGRWSEQVLTVNTFSDRLYSYQRLLKSSSWSMFGVESNIPSHDTISKVVLLYGVAGLALGALMIGVGCYYLHRTLLRIAVDEERNFAVFMAAAIVPAIAVGLAGSGNIDTTPINLQLWTFFGVAVSIIIHSESKKAADVKPLPVARRPAGMEAATYPTPFRRLDQGTV